MLTSHELKNFILSGMPCDHAQLHVNRELVGGADLVREMVEAGELQALVNPAA
jgi:glutaredoxin-related protein